MGLFDGTVGDSASEHLQKSLVSRCLAVPALVALAAKRDSHPYNNEDTLSKEECAVVETALRKIFHDLDDSFFDKFPSEDYCCSTGVVALLWGNTLSIAHVGDSKACIGRVARDGRLVSEWLTLDHKPNDPREKQRILDAGGSVVWLNGHKPYVRGGDFFQRHSLGHHPKQLNYSRAFGGRGLKNYGLVVDPAVCQLDLTKEDKVLIIGSDGLWDSLDPLTALKTAISSHLAGRDPAEDLANQAIAYMPIIGVSDNVSVIVMFLSDSLETH